jgi:hypothetical protein
MSQVRDAKMGFSRGKFRRADGITELPVNVGCRLSVCFGVPNAAP